MSDAAYTCHEIECLLSAAARARFRHVFTGAPDVIAALRERFPPAEPDPLYLPGLVTAARLLAVDIAEDADLGPGQFRLVRHSACAVNRSAVDFLHGNCPVIALGVLSP